jgi:hypothetical protein
MTIPLEIIEGLPDYRRDFIKFAERFQGTKAISELVAHHPYTPGELGQIREWLEQWGNLKSTEKGRINHARAMA